MTESIYGLYEPRLYEILETISAYIKKVNQTTKEETGQKLYEHFLGRVKTSDSMRDKCRRKGLAETTESALKEIRDSIGLRIVCGFVEDIYRTVALLKQMPGLSVCNEKDYITSAKPNGYRSYHMIVEMEVPFSDCYGQTPGRYFVEIQLRTIAMDSWAALEHQLKYKQSIKNPERIVKELKRCADELASCDLTMQTIRNLIRESGGE
ncbi:GTP pyrophosphokinase [Streptococcus sp. DD13]|nr:GTP pyrophosphokinase [Streptococcus sp. DD13]